MRPLYDDPSFLSSIIHEYHNKTFLRASLARTPAINIIGPLANHGVEIRIKCYMNSNTHWITDFYASHLFYASFWMFANPIWLQAGDWFKLFGPNDSEQYTVLN